MNASEPREDAVAVLQQWLRERLEEAALIGSPALSRRRDGALAAAIAALAQQGAEPVAAEMKALLHSTHEIALRRGADTNWDALAESIATLGIAPVTARHYFAEGTPRETINKHLQALLDHVNAKRAGAPR